MNLDYKQVPLVPQVLTIPNKKVTRYCKTLNIHGVKFSLFNENDILSHINFGIHDILWLKIIRKI